jgi:uncharacterized protein
VRIYVDSSALLKRVVLEADSAELVASLGSHAGEGDALVSSSLAWVEVTRALRSRISDVESALALSDVALSGILELPIDGEVVALARRLTPRVLRSLDAIHLASAAFADAEVMMAYDERLLAEAREHGFRPCSPS